MFKGETLKIEVTDADATAVSFKFGGASVQTIAGAATGTTWAATADTAAWPAGAYQWQAWATYADGTKSVISSGRFDIEEALNLGDARSSARKMVEMIEAMMAGNAGEGVRRYKINNRELERYSVAELLQLLTYWKRQALIESRAENGRSALGPRIAVRF